MIGAMRIYGLSGDHRAIRVIENSEDCSPADILRRIRQPTFAYEYADFMMLHLGAIRVDVEIQNRPKGVGPYRTHYECDDETATLIKMFLQ